MAEKAGFKFVKNIRFSENIEKYLMILFKEDFIIN